MHTLRIVFACILVAGLLAAAVWGFVQMVSG